MEFLEREIKRRDGENSRERAIAFSFEKVEGEYNSWIERDKYSNKILVKSVNNLEKNEDNSLDNFLQIVDYTLDALEKIVASPKNKLEKRQELQRVDKVNKIDNKTIIWLAAKPGKSIIEKIGIKQQVLAPKYVYTVEKKENQIVNYYVKKILKILEMRFLSYKNIDIENTNFNAIYARMKKIKRVMDLSGMSSLKKPLDFIPNNTMIDHREYSVINRGLRLINDYIKESECNEECLKEMAILVIFLNIVLGVKNLKNIKPVNKSLDIEKIRENGKEVVEFFIERSENYYVKLEMVDKKIYISCNEIQFTKNKLLKLGKSQYKKTLKVQLKSFNLKNNFLEFVVSNSGKSYILDGENFKKIVDNIITELEEKIVGEKEEKKEDIFENAGDKSYVNFSSLTPYLDSKRLIDTAYINSINQFENPENYFYLNDEKDAILNVSSAFSNGNNLEIFSRYLDKLLKDKKIKKDNLTIISMPEFLDSEIQRDINSIYESKFKKSYPIWRSILAVYSMKESANEKKDILIIDLNSLTPTINIVKIVGDLYEHHPVITKYSEELELLSLKNFFKGYLEKYLKKYKINIENDEIENIIASNKLQLALLDDKKSIITREKNSFYIEKDKNILNEMFKEINKQIYQILNNNKELLFKEKNVVIISDITLLKKNIFMKELNVETISDIDLVKAKDKIIEKILSDQIIWSEFLPNLNLEIVKDGHFSNLNLIKDKSINMKFGEEIIFEVDDVLELPANQKSMKFPLYSEDALNKNKSFLKIESSSFPLKEPLEVKLKIGYSYGKENPYRVIIESLDQNIEINTKWIELKEKIEIRKIEFPEIESINHKEIEKMFKVINNFVRYGKYEQLNEMLKKQKNRFRRYIVNKITNGEKDYVINILMKNQGILQLEKLKSYPKRLFLSSFGKLGKFDFYENEVTQQVSKRSLLFNYDFSNNNKILRKLEDSTKLEMFAEFSWLDKEFVSNLLNENKKLAKYILKYAIKEVNLLSENFHEQYEENKKDKGNEGKSNLWKLTNRFRDCLEYIIAMFLVEKDKNILFELSKKEREELLSNIKSIDKKIQLETDRYPELKNEFIKSTRAKIEIESKNGLDNVSDLVYTVFCYMTGNDGSDLIKIKEIVED